MSFTQEQAAPVQDGFVMVPVEPTPEMVEAARWEDGEHTARAVYAAMIAAAPKAVVQDGWMPIETAPKDGTEILAWRDDCGALIVSFRSPSTMPLTQDELDGSDEETLFQEDWFTQWPAAERLEGSDAPTHWMPLPAAPKAQETGA